MIKVSSEKQEEERKAKPIAFFFTLRLLSLGPPNNEMKEYRHLNLIFFLSFPYKKAAPQRLLIYFSSSSKLRTYTTQHILARVMNFIVLVGKKFLCADLPQGYKYADKMEKIYSKTYRQVDCTDEIGRRRRFQIPPMKSARPCLFSLSFSKKMSMFQQYLITIK